MGIGKDNRNVDHCYAKKCKSILIAVCKCILRNLMYTHIFKKVFYEIYFSSSEYGTCLLEPVMSLTNCYKDESGLF